jgi:hypothetical protein
MRRLERHQPQKQSEQKQTHPDASGIEQDMSIFKEIIPHKRVKAQNRFRLK